MLNPTRLRLAQVNKDDPKYVPKEDLESGNLRLSMSNWFLTGNAVVPKSEWLQCVGYFYLYGMVTDNDIESEADALQKVLS